MSKEQLPQALLIVEGKSDRLFFDSFCEHHKLENINIDYPKEGGKDKLFGEGEISALIKQQTNDGIKKIIIICDADFKDVGGTKYDGFEATKTKLQTLIRELKKEEELADREIKYFILPNNKDNGYLEKLFLSSINNGLEDIANCANKYIECSKKDVPIHKLDKIKAELIVKLACCGESNFYTVGNAAQKKQYWNFESESLKPLGDFLKKFINS